MTEERRNVLLGGARLAAAAALGGLALVLGLRRRERREHEDGYCHRAGRCAGCEATRDCETWQALHGEVDRGR